MKQLYCLRHSIKFDNEWGYGYINKQHKFSDYSERGKEWKI